MRPVLARLLVELGFKYSDLYVAASGPVRREVAALFAETFPDRYVDADDNVQDLVGIAAGIASCGKKVAIGIPVSALTAALTGAKELLESSQLDVKILGVYSDHEEFGERPMPCHLGDVAVMRTVAGMSILVPADPVELRACIGDVISSKGPAYVRVGVEGERVYSECICKLGAANVVRDGSDLAIVAMGGMVAEAIRASNELRSLGVSAAVIDSHTVRPLDRETIVRYARRTGAVVVAEDHYVVGGLGSAIAEVLMSEYPVPMAFVGAREEVCLAKTSLPELRRYLGLVSREVVEAARKVLRIR